MSSAEETKAEVKTGHRVVRNALFGVLSQALGGGLFFLSAILIARHLGPENYGPFSFVFAFVTVIHMVADFGITQIIVREISRNRDRLKEILGAVVPLVTLLAIIGVLVIITAAHVLPLGGDLVYAMYILGASVLLTYLSAVYGAVFRAYEKMGINAIVLVVQRIILFLGVLLFLALDGGFMEFAFCYLAERLAQWSILRILVRIRYSGYTWRVDPGYCKYILVEGLPVGAGMVLRRISWYLDIFILTALSTANAVGLFSAALRIIQLINVIPFTLSIPLFPVFSRLAVESRDRVYAIYARVLKVFVLISLPIAVWMVILGTDVIIHIFGEDYRQAGLTLTLMGPMIVLLFFNSLYVHIFSALDRQNLFMRAVAAGVTANVVLDFILIPFWGINGAALATVFSEALLLIVGTVLLARQGLYIDYVKQFTRPVVAVALSCVPLLTLGVNPSLGYIGIVSTVCGILYLLCLYLFKIVNEDDINVFLGAFSKRRLMNNQQA